MLPGETILSGASAFCPDCKGPLPFQVLRSGAGYYVGTSCCFGPVTRETSYFDTHNEAHKALWELSQAVVHHKPLPSYVRQ